MPAKPKSFTFPEPELELHESTYQRYVDADLATVTRTVSLEQKYGKPNWTLLIWLGVLALLLGIVFIGLIVWLATRQPIEQSKSRWEMDDEMSPFAAISLLQEIHSDLGLSDSKKGELAATIGRLEAHYFGEPENSNAPDLGSEVKKWAKLTS